MQTKICLARVQSPVACSWYCSQGLLTRVSSDKEGDHVYIQHARLHSASSAFTLMALFIFISFKVALDRKISFCTLGSDCETSLSIQHLTGYLEGKAGTVGSVLLNVPSILNTLYFVVLLSPELSWFCTSSWSLFPGPLSLLFGFH